MDAESKRKGIALEKSCKYCTNMLEVPSVPGEFTVIFVDSDPKWETERIIRPPFLGAEVCTNLQNTSVVDVWTCSQLKRVPPPPDVPSCIGCLLRAQCRSCKQLRPTCDGFKFYHQKVFPGLLINEMYWIEKFEGTEDKVGHKFNPATNC